MLSERALQEGQNHLYTSAISNLALPICSVHKNCLQNVFTVKSPVTCEEIVDMVRNQWLLDQNETVKEEYYKNLDSKSADSSRCQYSYWKAVEAESGLVSYDASPYYKRIDHFWRQIGGLRDERGELKYPQLFALIKCVLSVSHGNSTPERGFSINKIMLEAHGYSIYEDTIVALRTVKDELNRVGSLTKFQIDKDLIKEVKLSNSKYEADREERKALIEAQEAEKKKRIAEIKKQNEISKYKEVIDAEIEKCKSSLKVADNIIEDAKDNLQKALAKEKVDRNLTQQALSKI